MKNQEKMLEIECNIWDLRQRMWTYGRIAERLKLSESEVQHISARLYKKYARTFKKKISMVRDEHVKQLEYIQDEAMQSWEKSKLNQEVIKTKFGIKPSKFGLTSKDSKLLEKVTENRAQYGDPRFLLAIIKAQENIRKILGVDAPQKILHSGEISGVSNSPLSKITIDPIEASKIYQNIMEGGNAI